MRALCAVSLSVAFCVLACMYAFFVSIRLSASNGFLLLKLSLHIGQNMTLLSFLPLSKAFNLEKRVVVTFPSDDVQCSLNVSVVFF